MTLLETPAAQFPVLADRLPEGKLPLPLALRYGLQLGESLRDLHDSGRAHGALSPETVVLTDTGLDLMPAQASVDDLTLAISHDISGFGAVLYAMLTGQKATQDTGFVPEPSGLPAADRLIAACLKPQSPAQPMSMHKVMLELKLVAVASRRNEFPLVKKREAADAALRSELQQSEARQAARLEEFEKRIAATLFTASNEFTTLREELGAFKTELAPVLTSMDAAAARFTAIEDAVEQVRQSRAILADETTERITLLESHLSTQADAIESVRVAVAHSDDLLERVVEAMEAIQDSILDTPAR